MRRLLVLLLALALVPVAAAQGPPQDPGPGQSPGPPEERPGNQTGGPGGQPEDRPGPPEERSGPPVWVEDARDGFGARPVDPHSLRPSFTYDAPRATMAAERSDAPGITAVVDAIIEFTDEDGDGAYGVGEPVLRRHALRDLEVEVHAPSQTVRDAVHAIPGGGNLTLRFHLDGAGEEDAAKFDVIVQDYPFTNGSSRLALVLRVEAGQAMRLDEVQGEPAVVATGDGPRPYLSWAPTVLANGSAHQVAASVHLDAVAGSALVHWAYPQAATIVHDPVVGFVTVAVERLGEPVVFVTALVAGSLLLLAGYEARRRFRP